MNKKSRRRLNQRLRKNKEIILGIEAVVDPKEVELSQGVALRKVNSIDMLRTVLEQAKAEGMDKPTKIHVVVSVYFPKARP